MRLKTLAALIALGLATTSAAIERTWTNDQGETIEAELLNVRGDTAFLRSGGKRIPAPLERLSEADRQWIAQYQELTGERDWGASAEPVTGVFRSVEDEGIKLRAAGETLVLPFAKLTQNDWAHLAARFKHTGESPPESFAAARARAKPIEPPADAVTREWTDTRGRNITAAYERAQGAHAILWVKGKRYEYPLAQLSEADRKWVARQSVQQLLVDLQGGVAAVGSIAMSRAAGPPPNGGPPPGQFYPDAPPGGEFRQGEFQGGYVDEYGQPSRGDQPPPRGFPREALQGRPLIGGPPPRREPRPGE